MEKKDKYLYLARAFFKKSVEYESDDYTSCIWWSWYNYRMIGSGTGGPVNNTMSRDYLNCCMV